MRILIINGPNLNLLGKRNPTIYGTVSFDEYIQKLSFKGVELTVFQSNKEGEIIDQLQQSKVDGIVLNAGGYTHTSVAIRDTVEAIETPVVEVHISNLAQRETFRHDSLITPVATGSIVGFGLDGYQLAIHYFLNQKR